MIRLEKDDRGFVLHFTIVLSEHAKDLISQKLKELCNEEIVNPRWLANNRVLIQVKRKTGVEGRVCIGSELRAFVEGWNMRCELIRLMRLKRR